MVKVSSTLPPSNRHLEPFELAPYLTQFTAQMMSAGFTALTISSYTDAVSHFGTWLNKNSISACSVTPRIVERFSTHRCTCIGGRRNDYVSKKYARRVSRFVDYLREIEVLDNDITHKVEPTPRWDRDGFIRWLSDDRGLANITVANYVRALALILPDLGYDANQYCAQQIRRVVCQYSEDNGIWNTKRLTTALSSYLRYLVTKDICPYALIASVPTVAHWRLATLPRYISIEEVQQVVQSCNTDQTVGMRDHAVLLLLARLGLRASDIVNLQMSDIDWNRATLRVCGKARKESLLPLPQDAGDAILRYLAAGRISNTPYTQLFLCVTAPHRPLGGSQSVASIVRSAILRSGITTPASCGAHLLRHSAATGWLRQGATLDSVSTMLRHSSTDMTMHYAKIDVNSLNQLAVQWPEDAS